MYNVSPKRYNMTQLVDYVKAFAENTYRVRVSNVVSIDEVPEEHRHSCPQTGIAILNREICTINMGYGSIDMPYFICPVCGKLYIYKS